LPARNGKQGLTDYGNRWEPTSTRIPGRLERGEPADVLIMVGYASADLVKNGKGLQRRSDLVNSLIGGAVSEAGAQKATSFGGRGQGGRCSRKNRSPIPTAPAQRSICIEQMFAKLGIAAR